MIEEDRILDKLRKVEALFAGAATPGEKKAAEAARERITERLRNLQKLEKELEWKFSFDNPWSRKLFVALLRRYGIKPYRIHGQRRTTIMANMPRSFLNDTLWAEYESLNQILLEHIEHIAEKVIQEAIFSDISEAEEK